jgi:hypothetical protein
VRCLFATSSWPASTRYATMPSLTSEPITCPARQTSAVPALPSARLAPKTASAISTGQTTTYPGATSAESSSGRTGSCSRFVTLVLAHAISLACAAGVSRA